MPTTIQMPSEFNQMCRTMCSDVMAQTVRALAEKYKFDLDEASQFLELDSLKVEQKKEKKEKKEKKSDSDEEKLKKKRAATGNQLFNASIRADVTTELREELDEGDKMERGAVLKECGVRWKALEQSVRDDWNAKAKTPATSDDDA